MNRISSTPIRELFDTLWDLEKSGIVDAEHKTWGVRNGGWYANILVEAIGTGKKVADVLDPEKPREFWEKTPEGLRESVLTAVNAALKPDMP